MEIPPIPRNDPYAPIPTPSPNKKESTLQHLIETILANIQKTTSEELKSLKEEASKNGAPKEAIKKLDTLANDSLHYTLPPEEIAKTLNEVKKILNK